MMDKIIFFVSDAQRTLEFVSTDANIVFIKLDAHELIRLDREDVIDLVIALNDELKNPYFK